MVSVGAATIGFPDPANPGLNARTEIIDLRHVVRLEPFGATTQGG
jgi:hypothetical protein